MVPTVIVMFQLKTLPVWRFWSYPIAGMETWEGPTEWWTVLRSGSSLLGELLSLPTSSSYYFEPLWQHKLSCEERRDNTRIAGRLDNILGGLLNCQDKQINNLARSDITLRCTVQCTVNSQWTVFEYLEASLESPNDFQQIFSEKKESRMWVYWTKCDQDNQTPS